VGSKFLAKILWQILEVHQAVSPFSPLVLRHRDHLHQKILEGSVGHFVASSTIPQIWEDTSAEHKFDIIIIEKEMRRFYRK
jgi:hypothetical protein